MTHNEDGLNAVQETLDLELWDIRLASILNTLEIARTHGEHRDWTSAHSAQIRQMMSITDAAVLGEGDGVVPQGFGKPVRAQLSAAFVRAKATADAEAARIKAAEAVTTTGDVAAAGTVGTSQEKQLFEQMHPGRTVLVRTRPAADFGDEPPAGDKSAA
jgi:hypothetical protein